jgi:hypothetical protein
MEKSKVCNQIFGNIDDRLRIRPKRPLKAYKVCPSLSADQPD